MIKQLQETPKIWLNLELCNDIYDTFRNELSFSEPLKPFQTRYEGKLEGILGAVQQTFAGDLLYPTILDVAVAYYCKICRQHPFENGNKRMCVLYTDVFLQLNDIELVLPHEDMYVLATFVADTRDKKNNWEHASQACRNIIADFCRPI